MASAKESENRDAVVFVNKQQVKVEQNQLNGAKILEAAHLNPNEYDLYLIKGQNSQKIGQSEVIEIKNGMHFNAILRSAPYG